MNANDIKNEIRELKKQEQLQFQKLENIKKSEAKTLQLSNSRVIGTVNDFQSKLNELLEFYQRINLSDFNNNSNFISEHDLTVNEQQEKDIFELLEKAQEKLELFSEKNDYLSNISKESDIKFQESLYLLHDAQMNNVALQAELASLNAKICHLNNPSVTKNQLKSNKECDIEIDELKEKISNSIKEICKNKIILEIKPDLERNLDLQIKSANFIHQILEQYNKQLNRQNMRIEALNKELEIHENVENIFNSISNIIQELNKLQEQMDGMTKIVNSLQEPKLSNDEQLLIRMKSYSAENAKEFQMIFESMDSVRIAYNKEKIEKSEALGKFIKIFEKSLVQFDKIYKNTQSFSDYVNENSFNRWNNKLTLMNKRNSDLLNSVDTNRLSKRIKQLKEILENIKVDILIG